jgi:hypothetical protein
LKNAFEWRAGENPTPIATIPRERTTAGARTDLQSTCKPVSYSGFYRPEAKTSQDRSAISGSYTYRDPGRALPAKRDFLDSSTALKLREVRNDGSLSNRDHYRYSKTSDDRQNNLSVTRKDDLAAFRREPRDTLGSATRKEYSYARPIQPSPIKDFSKARDFRKENLENAYGIRTSSRIRDRGRGVEDTLFSRWEERVQTSSPISQRPEIKLLDLSKVVKPAITAQPSENSFIALNSYYNTDADVAALEKLETSPEGASPAPDGRAFLKGTAEAKNGARESSKQGTKSAETRDLGSQLEFVEIPCADFVLDPDHESGSSSSRSQKAIPVRPSARKPDQVQELTILLEEKDIKIRALQGKNDELKEEINKMKLQMARQIQMLTTEVNHAKSMVLSTSTMSPSMPDTARSRSGKSPLTQSGCAHNSFSESDQLSLSLVREIAEVFMVVANGRTTSEAMKSFIDMSIRRVTSGADLYTSLRSTKDLVVTCIESLDRGNHKGLLRVAELEGKVDKEKQRFQRLDEELALLRWQSSVLNTCFENFQFITSTITRSTLISNRNFASCSKEYFEEARRLLKKAQRRREPSEDEANFSYMNSLVRQMADCFG